jgi:rhomboid protease GluP
MELGRPRIRKTILSRRPRENSVLVALAAVMGMLFVSMLCWQEGREMQLRLAAVSERVFVEGEYWRLTTALLVHADMRHFLSNSILFVLFAYLLFGYYGFWIFPVAGFLLGSVVNYLSLLTYQPQNISLVGASGMVYLMVGFWLTMYMLVERRLSVKRRILHGVGVGLIVLMPTAFDHAVSYRSHFLGVVMGIAFALLYFHVRKDWIRSAEEVDFSEVWQDAEVDSGGYVS